MADGTTLYFTAPRPDGMIDVCCLEEGEAMVVVQSFDDPEEAEDFMTEHNAEVGALPEDFADVPGDMMSLLARI